MLKSEHPEPEVPQYVEPETTEEAETADEGARELHPAYTYLFPGFPYC